MMNKNGQVFTPPEYVMKLLDEVSYFGIPILDKIFLENSVGNGNILIEAVRRYLVTAKNLKIEDEKLKRSLENNFIAFEVDKKVIEECCLKLDELVLQFGLKNIRWNIKNENYLRYDINLKADYIVGNPPYIKYTDIQPKEREYLKNNYKSCYKGKFDYCYAFIEKSIYDLNDNGGRMAYFIPSSIFKNTFGKELRQIMLQYTVKIIDFQHRKVFGNALTSPAIISLDKDRDSAFIEYSSLDTLEKINISKDSLMDKWIFSKTVLSGSSTNELRFSDFFHVHNSVATLLNEVFVLKNAAENIMESEILKDAASPRSIAFGKEEKIIFPYYFDNESNLIRIEEKEFLEKYPKVSEYLQLHIDRLKRRKADGMWYEYGRTQALKYINQEKVLMSSIITDKIKLHKLSKNTVPYSGFFITQKGELSLEKAIDILETDTFNKYIFERAINANGKSIRISVNDIKNYTFTL